MVQRLRWGGGRHYVKHAPGNALCCHYELEEIETDGLTAPDHYLHT